MSSSNNHEPMKASAWHGLVRSPESGGRRSRTLRDDAESAQVQAKLTTVTDPKTDDESRILQIRFWTEEGGWNHLVIDPNLPGLPGLVAIGYGRTESDSWEMAREHALDGYGIAR
jgi:hypothetical protein